MASARYRFVHGDICDAALVDALVAEERPDAIVHFAAESHVDRSILSPEPVVRTNYTAPSRCSKRPGCTRSRASCTSPPTKSTAAWRRPPKPTRSIR